MESLRLSPHRARGERTDDEPPQHEKRQRLRQGAKDGGAASRCVLTAPVLDWKSRMPTLICAALVVTLRLAGKELGALRKPRVKTATRPA